MASAIDFCLPNKDMTYAEQFKIKQNFVQKLFSSEEITYHESIHRCDPFPARRVIKLVERGFCFQHSLYAAVKLIMEVGR